MLKSLRQALKVKEVRQRLLFTLLMLIVIRFGSNLPIPGVNTDYLKNFFEQQRQGAGNAFNFFNAITGGSFEQMSVLALSITPYITSSIIMELMTIAIPQLEELQREGEDGRKKMLSYTRYLTVALALIQSIAMAVGFGSQGLLTHFTLKSIFVTIAAMTAGSAFLMWIGERITEKGVGNGISIVLLINILSSIPNDFATLWERFIMNAKSPATAVVAGLIIVAFILLMTVFVVLLCDAERHIPVQYTAKMQGRRMMSNGQSSEIPLKVNTAGVIPVIFASSIMSMPVVIAQFFNVDYASIPGKIIMVLNSSNWLKPERPAYSVGLLLYIVLIILFAYFYTSITFNPLEVANNMKKSGGFIPGIRPGRPTSDYLSEVLKYVIFLGATGLTIVAVIPIFISGVFNIGSLTFTGNSLIIIVGVILETLKSIESITLVKNYRGFLGN